MAWRKSPLFLAARDGDLGKIKHLAERGVPLAISVDITLLHVAAMRGRFEVVEYLVRNNCDINRKAADGRTAVLVAAEKHHKNIVDLLVKSGAHLGGCTGLYKWTLLHYACFYDWTQIVQIILEKEAAAVNAKSSDMRTPLMLALQNGNEAIAEALIASGAEFRSCDNEGKNVLHYACSTACCSKEGLAKIVKCIVERGETDLRAKSIYRWTPLRHAVSTKKEDVAEILIQAGAITNAELLHCIHLGRTKLVRMIVESGGCDLNPTSGHIPLYLACLCRNFEAVKVMISAGADVNLKYGRNANETALGFGIYSEDLELIRLLVHHGAYFRSLERQLLSRQWELRKILLEDAQLCTQILINKFNNCSLPAVYNVPFFRDALPQIESVTIDSDGSTAAQEIANFVDSQIQTKEFCNVFGGYPIVLKLICVEWLVKNMTTI